jgi:hypothetical protein
MLLWLLLKSGLNAVWLGIEILRPLLFVRALQAASAPCRSEQAWLMPLRAYRVYRRLQNNSMRFDGVAQ